MTRYRIPIAIVIAGAIIAGAVYALLHSEPSATNAVDITAMRPIGPNDEIIGNPLAPVLFVEYCSADSAYCAPFTAALRSLAAAYGTLGRVAVIMRPVENAADLDAQDPNGDDLAAMGATSVPFTIVFIRGQKPLTINGSVSYETLKQLADQALSSASTSDSR